MKKIFTGINMIIVKLILAAFYISIVGTTKIIYLFTNFVSGKNDEIKKWSKWKEPKNKESFLSTY
jgi:hypothetical protein